MKGNIIFVNSHPIQYFAPLYQAIEKEGSFNLEVWYCTKHGLEGEIDKQFGTSVKWDIPLLEGYKFRFLKNNSWKPGIYSGFWGLLNLEVIKLLWKAPKSIVVVHGWNYATTILTLLVAKIFGHTTAIRGEAPITLERLRSGSGLLKRKIIFSLLFPFSDYFLYVGENNRRFYELYKVKEKQLVFTPYAVDNNRFKSEYNRLFPDREIIRQQKGLNTEVIYALFSGKYIHKKHPMDLLSAVYKLQSKGYKVGAIFMGDGELRGQMEDFIKTNAVKNIILTGFVNQSEISLFYVMADLFVMCSDEGETWGLSTNEAMNFGLPVVSYDSVGSCLNLVKSGENGYIVEKLNVDMLADGMEKIISDKDSRIKLGNKSREIIEQYSYANIIKGLSRIG